MKKLDILNREIFVSDLVKLVNQIALTKSSTYFSINGSWGCGKSFVLDMLQEELENAKSEDTLTNAFFVIRYNSWMFDYYEEPLIAIVSSMINSIEEKNKIFPDNKHKYEILGVLKAACVTLLSMGSAALKEQINVDIQQAYQIIQSGITEGAAAYERNHEYDGYFGFNKVMKALQDLLQNLAEKYTLVFLVDELDRCMPEYAIKVLERLHHLTEEKINIITIIPIDRNQLLSSVKQIFGFDNPAKYLEKFIHFDVPLDYGTVSQKITEKYTDYISLFDKELFKFSESIEECLQAIFKDIDIRKQEQIVKKTMLVHKLLYNEKKDYSFMCMELLLAVMICVYNDNSCFSETSINLDSFDKIFTPYANSAQPAFSEFFKRKFESISFSRKKDFSDDPLIYLLPEQTSLYGSILLTWYWMHPSNRNNMIQYTKNGKYEIVSNNHEELKKYAETIKMIS